MMITVDAMPSFALIGKAQTELLQLDDELIRVAQRIADIDARLIQLSQETSQRQDAVHRAHERLDVATLRVQKQRTAYLHAVNSESEERMHNELLASEAEFHVANTDYCDIAEKATLDTHSACAETATLHTERDELLLQRTMHATRRTEVLSLEQLARDRVGYELFDKHSAQAHTLRTRRAELEQELQRVSVAISDHDKQADSDLEPYRELQRDYRLTYVAIEDDVTERLNTVLAYRRMLLAHCQRNGWLGLLPLQLFIPNAAELSSPKQHMGVWIQQAERELASHIQTVRNTM